MYVIKKDGTREKFDVQKIVRAVNKSAARAMYTFSEEETRESPASLTPLQARAWQSCPT